MAKNEDLRPFGEPVEAAGTPVGPKTIILPESLVESLLVAIAGGDRVAITAVGADIRRLAEDQSPAKFPTHRR